MAEYDQYVLYLAYPVMAVLPLTAMYNMWYNARILLTHK